MFSSHFQARQQAKLSSSFLEQQPSMTGAGFAPVHAAEHGLLQLPRWVGEATVASKITGMMDRRAMMAAMGSHGGKPPPRPSL